MKPTPFAFQLLFAALLVTSLAPVPLRAQNAGDTVRRAGQVTLHAGVGSVNGARLGASVFPFSDLSVEMSAGYIKVGIVEEDNDHTIDGVALTLGGNWFSHPDNDISPMISLLLTYISTTENPDGYEQQRFAISPAVGTEYHMTSSFSLFFRLGLSFQYIDDRVKTSSPVTGHFDAGIGWTF